MIYPITFRNIQKWLTEVKHEKEKKKKNETRVCNSQFTLKCFFLRVDEIWFLNENV